MMRLSGSALLAKPRPRTALADRPLEEILRIPHTASIQARLAAVDPRDDANDAQSTALRKMLEDAEERDLLAAERPDGCWCFGRGGMIERGVMLPGDKVPMVLGVYCVCSEADARRKVDQQIREAGRLYAEQGRISVIWDAARIPERFNACTLETFPVTTRPMQAVLRVVRDWLTSDDWAIVLHGGFGVGKTGIGIGMLRLAAERRQVGLFVKAPDLLTRVRATYGKNADATEADVLDSLRTAPLLMLDDLGADRQGDWATEMLFQVLDARHDGGLKTIITTNLDRPDLAVHLGARTMHRFDEGALFLNVEGPNLRKAQKGSN